MRICDACRVQMTSEGKRHFPRKVEISSKMSPFWLPFSVTLGTFFEPFAPKWPKGSRATPQSAKSAPKWSPRVPKWSPRVPKCPPEVPKSSKKTPKCAPRVLKWRPKVPQWSPQGHPKCHKDATSPSKCRYNTKMCPKVPKNKQAHTDTNKQPTNQINKEGYK